MKASRRARFGRWAEQVAVALLCAFLVVWSIVPLYNMVRVALQEKEDVFSSNVIPVKPSLQSFWTVFHESYWLLANFWGQMGNSFYLGIIVASLTLAMQVPSNNTNSFAGRHHLYLNDTGSPYDFLQLGWNVATNGTSSHTMEVDPALLQGGNLNVAIDANCKVDFAVLYLQVAPGVAGPVQHAPCQPQPHSPQFVRSFKTICRQSNGPAGSHTRQHAAP